MEKTNPVIVETNDLTKVYGDGEQIFALNKVNLRIAAGELVAVMGPSGSGKSTLLNILGALDIPTSGQVLINGEDLALIQDKDRFRAKTVGFVFQLHNLIPTLTARENVEIPMMGYYPANERRKRAGQLLELVGLGDRMNHLPAQLSGGQRQRVAIARALANEPLIVLADEPTGNLDSQASLELMRLIAQLNQSQGTTFIVVTHDLAVARQTRRVLAMADGKIVREDIIGSPLEEDLKMWRYSGLGRRIVEGKLEELQMFNLKPKQQKVIRKLLELAEKT
ncbi:MAG: ABC transporter ATP-binding protein [Anaerolineae bacterium]|jgi:ABC-type lipoprotein export system ATPase subunit|nr:MAG: ABC transporter ATP-binding protein [Anaerolineae bacterium]